MIMPWKILCSSKVQMNRQTSIENHALDSRITRKHQPIRASAQSSSM
jgi:hypothetical protein